MLTGTLVNYYYHCKRQCWLFYNKINMEDNSEEVRIGRVLHELKDSHEIAIESIKLDKILDKYVVEIKKSDADMKATEEQLKFYIITLCNKGIYRDGKVEYIEKNKQDKKIYYIKMSDDEIIEKRKEYAEIEKFLCSDLPAEAVIVPKCKKCAYYEYCAL